MLRALANSLKLDEARQTLLLKCLGGVLIPYGYNCTLGFKKMDF